MGGPIDRLARRFVLTLGGELVQSGFHFGLNVALARMLTAEDYGIFAIVMLLGGVALTYVRALVGMPVGLLVSQRRDSRAARALQASFGSAALALSALIAGIVAAVLHLWLQAGALPGALFVGLWSLRSYIRTTLLAKHRQVAAGLSDLALMTTGTALALLFLRRGDTHPLETVFFILAGANALAIGVALALQAEPVRVTFRASTRRRLRGLARQLVWSAASTTAANAQAQGQVLLVATLAGPTAYAPIAAMLVLFAPVRLMAAALANMVQPELATRLASGTMPRFGRLMILWSGFVALVGLVYGLVAAAAVPVMGPTVFAGQPTLLIGALAWGITNTFLLSLVPRLLLEVVRAFSQIALISAVSAALGMAAVATLLSTTSPAWSLSGNLLAEMVVLVWSWIATVRHLRLAAARGAICPARAAAAPLAGAGLGDCLQTRAT